MNQMLIVGGVFVTFVTLGFVASRVTKNMLSKWLTQFVDLTDNS